MPYSAATYTWLTGVAIAGSIIGYMRQRRVDKVQGRSLAPWYRDLNEIVYHMAISTFAAFLAYWLLEYVPDMDSKLHVRVALSGISAFMGEEILIAIGRRADKTLGG